MDCSERDETIRRMEDCDPGEDPEDPYAHVAVGELPEWWRKAHREFEAYGLRPYRPPRFVDGTLKYEVVEELERDLGVELSFTCIDSAYTDRWEVRIDGDVIDHIGRFRSPAGYTTYQMDADAFVSLVESAVHRR